MTKTAKGILAAHCATLRTSPHRSIRCCPIGIIFSPSNLIKFLITRLSIFSTINQIVSTDITSIFLSQRGSNWQKEKRQKTIL